MRKNIAKVEKCRKKWGNNVFGGEIHKELLSQP